MQTRVTVHVFCTLSYSALHLCEVSFNILKVFQPTERTREHGINGYVQCSKGNNSKSGQTRVTAYVFCTSVHSALHLYEFW